MLVCNDMMLLVGIISDVYCFRDKYAAKVHNMDVQLSAPGRGWGIRLHRNTVNCFPFNCLEN